MPNRRAGLLVVALSILVPAAARSEILTFADGSTVHLSAEVDGPIVRVIGPEGPLEFRVDDFRSIVPGHWPPAEWPDRRDRALASDASDRLRASWWALEHGLIPEAVSLLRSAAEADPSLEPAARLVSVADRLEQPGRSPDLAPLRRVLPTGLSAVENARIVLLHQHSDEEASDRLDLLDRALTSFYLTFSSLGFDLRIPPEKLVAVWLAEESDYLAFLRKETGTAFLKTRGYYHPTRRVVFFFDGRSRADHRRAMDGHKAQLIELDRAEASLAATLPDARFRLTLAGDRPRVLPRDGASQAIDLLRRETNRDILNLELDRLRIDQAAAVHETIHQAVIASGLAPRYEAFPVWLHEGIATQFEGFRGNEWAGLGSSPPHRLEPWRRLRTPPPIEPMLRDDRFGLGDSVDEYALCWALIYDLRTRHPEAFVSLIDRLRNPGFGFDGESPGLAAFCSALGPDLDAYRLDWFDAMRSVRLPTEDPDSPASPTTRRRASR